MAGYFIAPYNVIDPETYAQYNPGSMGTIMQTLERHGGRVLAAGKGEQAEWVSGSPTHVYVVLEFPTTQAAHAWHDDPDYAAAKAIRLRATDNITTMILPEFVMPTG